MSPVSRETVRDKLAELLTAKLVDGSPKLAQVVNNCQTTAFVGQSPVVNVYSAGSFRERATTVGSKTQAYLWVAVFVTTVAEGEYTEATAEDLLDSIEQAVAEVLESNFSLAGFWTSIGYADRTVIEGPLAIGGKPYNRELIPITYGVFG